MASLIPCPFCGLRPADEFTPRGDVPSPRPAWDAPSEHWHAHVYLRENIRGRHLEHWHHLGGCRRWLIVDRDTLSHEVHAVHDARKMAQGIAATAGRPDAPEPDNAGRGAKDGPRS
ncbi:MAG: sarcosine oxidase subunit delta [Burkholderiaceae bacterium]